MTRKVRVGIIGCGGIARRHADSWSAIPDADLVACCDVDEGRARALASEHGARGVYTDAERMLGEGAVDAVSICTPHPAHAPLLIAAARNGVHAIVEKPLTTDLAEADRMIEAAKAGGIKFGTIFQRRFFPAAQRIRRAIDDGRMGTVTLGECFSRLKRDRAYFARDPWRGCWDTEGGGALMNQAVHMIDLLQWYMGPAEEVYGRWATLKHGDYIDVEDTVVATIAFRSGALAMIEAATTFDPPFGFRVAVHGTSGATVSLEESPESTQAVTDVWTFDGEEEGRAAWERDERGRPGFPEFHRLQLEDFARAVIEDREPAVTGAEGRKSLELILAIYRTQGTRRPVTLPMTPD